MYTGERDKSTEEASYRLNDLNTTELEKEKLTQKKNHGKPNPSTGSIGVHKQREKHVAKICYDGNRRFLGSFKTKEDHVAYDRFVIDYKSTEEIIFVLNYLNY